jgi:protein-L-isoaspartate O-methyltransferase
VTLDWKPFAAELAGKASPARSRWSRAVAETPRHLLVPRWFEPGDSDRGEDGWSLSNEPPECAYANRSLITQVGTLHADHATSDDHPQGMPASSATHPGLVVQMLRLGHLREGDAICDMGTGSGYSAALLCHQFGDTSITSIDIDPYLTKAATERLGQLGHHPAMQAMDAAQALPSTFDTIVAMFSVRPCPPSWLAALRPGGRIVFVIAGTQLVVCADKNPDGSASGQVNPYSAGFMQERHAVQEPETGQPDMEDGDHRVGRYPVMDVEGSWDLRSAFGLAVPGVYTSYTERDGIRALSLWHRDGSWAAARGRGAEAAEVRQAGPRRLWDELEEILNLWVPQWSFPWYMARVGIDPDGTIHLTATGGQQFTVRR